MVPLLPFLLLAPSSGVGAATAAMVEGVAQPDGDEGTTGSAELSFANATGNTENLTLILKGQLEVDRGAVEHDFNAGARYAESAARGQARVQTQEAFFASYQLDADLSDRLFAFARTRYDYDAFSGFEHRVFTGGGLGYRFAETEAVNWTVSGGPGIRWTRLALPDAPAEDFEREQTEFSAYASSDLDWDVTEAVSFQHDARVTYTDTSTTLETEAALRSKLTDSLSARFSYRLQHETSPAEGREATDTLMTAGIVYGF